MTLRLWLDPSGPNAERACCSPDAVIACARDVPRARPPARHARPARGVQGHRRAGVRRRLRRRPDAEPVHALQRRASGSTRSSRSPTAWAPTRSGRATTRGSSSGTGLRLVARGVDPAKDQSYMLATVDPALLDRVGFPLGGETKAEVRAEAAVGRSRGRGAGPRARRRASSPAATTAASSRATGSGRPRATIVDEAGTVLGRHDGLWRFTPGQRRGLGVAAREPLHVTPLRARVEHARRRASRAPLGARHVIVRGRLYDPVTRGRGEAPLPLARRRSGRRRRRADGLRPRARTSRSRPSRRDRSPCSTTDDVVVGAGVIARATG